MVDSTSEASVPFGLWLVAVGIFFLVFAGRINRLSMSDQNDPGPRAVPIVLSLCLVAGGLSQALLGWRRQQPPLAAGPLSDSTSRWAVVTLGGLLLIYLLAVPWLGFHLPTFLFALVMTWRMGGRWWVALLTAAGLLIVIQLLFVQGFRVQLPRGVFGVGF